MKAFNTVAAALLLSGSVAANAKVVSQSIIDWSAMTITADPGLSVAFNPLYGWDGGMSSGSVELGLVTDNTTRLFGTWADVVVSGNGSATLTVPFLLSASTSHEHVAPVYVAEVSAAEFQATLNLGGNLIKYYSHQVFATNYGSGAANSDVESGAMTFKVSSQGPDRTYRLRGTQWVNASVSSALPIPEPESYAMLLGGLAAIAVTRRRRHS